MRGKKFFRYHMNFMLAVDCEQMDSHLHDLFTFLQQLLFPVNSTDRPLRQNDLTILDFLMSDLFKNACVRQTHTDANFLGGSKVFTELLESMREERRNAPKQKGKGKQKQAETSSSTSSSSSSSSSSTDSPEMSNKDMQRLLMKVISKLPTTPEPDDKDDSETQMVTRSSSGKKQKQKRQKTQ